MDDLQIIVLEPYYGGSHKTFLEGLKASLPFRFYLLSLPARKWKWRMRLAAVHFARQLESMGRNFLANDSSIIFCSSFVDVATLRSLLPSWASDLPVYTYFHENQFAYPVQVEAERDFHFAITNYTTALASDKIAFNSLYNQNSFLEGAQKLIKKAPDMQIDSQIDILRKSNILHPGLDFSYIDKETEQKKPTVPLILWNHRWEHDKNPEQFFQTLYEMERNGFEFGLIIAGESFQRQPKIFAEAKKKLAGRIYHFGFIESRHEYIKWLKQADLVISTAAHEFYGISIIEAVRAGCRPLLPNRLSYRELFPKEFLYEKDLRPQRIVSALKKGRLNKRLAKQLTGQFSWTALAEKYSKWFTFAGDDSNPRLQR